jgi:subtilase family serine protease
MLSVDMRALVKTTVLVRLSILMLIGCGSTFPAFAGKTTHDIAVCPGPAPAGYARCHLRVIVDENGKPFVTNTPPPGSYGPLQFQTAYGVVDITPSTPQTIGIVDAYDDPNAESDLNTYSEQFGLPECTTANGCFKKVNQSGGPIYPHPDPTPGHMWAMEISLDVQITHAMCPACKILLVEANSNSTGNLLAAEFYATYHATVVSNSWGGIEFAGETLYDGRFNRPGIPITFSSGDSGYGVDWPATSHYVNAVGGTTLTLNADNTRASETAWSGSGSGCSAYEPKPAWQKDAGCKHRTVADVSADADPATGAAVYDSYGGGGWFQAGGTSLASPLIASIYALAGNGTSTKYGSYPYSNVTYGTTLFDVVSGSDGSCSPSYLCTAGPGYDGPTGLGTPIGTGAF